MKKSIKRAVWKRIIATICSTLVFNGVVLLSLVQLREGTDRISQASGLMDQAYTAEVAHYKWSSGLSSAIYEGEVFSGSTGDTGCSLGKWLYGEVDTSDEGILRLREQLLPLHRTIHASAADALELLARDQGEARRYYRDTIQGNITELVGLLDQVVKRSETLSTEGIRDMEGNITRMTVLCFLCFAVTLACLISLIQYVVRKVIRPILRITDESGGLAEGKLSFHPDIHTQDELGTLSGTLERSLGIISGYITEIGRIMEELARGNFAVTANMRFVGDFQKIEASVADVTGTLSAAIAQIDTAADQVSEGAKQVSGSATALAQGATEQASAVEELLATVTEITSNVQENAAKAQEARVDAKQAEAQMRASDGRMRRMEQAMGSIKETSQEIQSIISIIENIAFQTNILALNAAVEAARAGAAGKGFAVVADEVRNLAAKSDEAAKATKDLIEKSIVSVQEGGEIMTGVTDSLKQMMELSERSTVKIEEIAAAMQDESVSIGQVTEGIGQISAVIQANSATSEESAAASQELSAQSSLLRGQIEGFRRKDLT